MVYSLKQLLGSLEFVYVPSGWNSDIPAEMFRKQVDLSFNQADCSIRAIISAKLSPGRGSCIDESLR